MHKLTFHPLGNADCCRIDLHNGKKILFDYSNVADPTDATDRRIDLAKALRKDLEVVERDYYDIVAFTHLDNDHVSGSSEFFEFDHARKLQGNDRIKIKELWVPAVAIFEDGCEGAARVVQAEARHRLREGYGVRVFSRPERLHDWLKKQGLTVDDRKQFITDAGQVIPGLTSARDGVEFFLHSPFAFRTDEGDVVDRNGSSIVVQATFTIGSRETKVILASDVTHDDVTDFVTMTRRHGNEKRLESDVVKLPHHCSYTAIGSEKGSSKTEPVPNVKWLYEEQMRWGAIMVSSSKPIPADDSDDQPPHRQAAKYYTDVSKARGGDFKVTMEHPSKSSPKPIVVLIDEMGPRMEKSIPAAAAVIAGTSAPRAG